MIQETGEGRWKREERRREMEDDTLKSYPENLSGEFYQIFKNADRKSNLQNIGSRQVRYVGLKKLTVFR